MTDDDGIDLANRRCKPCRADTPPLAEGEIARMLTRIPGWEHREGAISRTFRFPNYWQTIAFVNAAAWVAHREDHHPELTVGYGTCRVAYWTHAVNGISENDFICAAKVDALFALGRPSPEPVGHGEEQDEEKP